MCGSSPCALSDGAQGHGLFDLSQRQHHGQAWQRGEPRIPHVVVGEVVIGLLVGEFGCKTKQKQSKNKETTKVSIMSRSFYLLKKNKIFVLTH